MKTSHRIFPLVLGFFCAFALMSHAGGAHAAKSGRGGDVVNKVVEINRQALAQIQAGKFDAARDALWNAITTLTDAGLAEHEIKARTHVHLAAVYLIGFKDKSKAVRQFVMALKINPNIKITPQVDSPEMTEAMDTARLQMAGGGSAPAAEPVAAEPSPEPVRTPARKAEDVEPFPPSKVKEPLYCPLPNEVPPNEDIMVRCVTRKKSRQASATLFYREAGSENFTPLPMIRSSKGWLSATVPGNAVTGSAFSFYISAKVPGSKDASLGSAESPTLLPVVSGASLMNNTMLISLMNNQGGSISTAVADEDDSAPLKEITDQYRIDEELRKYHRRYVGSVFISLGGGMGMTYHGSMTAAGSFTDKDGNRLDSLPAGAGSNVAGLFQLLPEIGYVVSETFAISVQGRIQYQPFDSTSFVGGQKPPTLALAGFLRGQYNFWTIANFQTFVSAAVGGGPHVFMGSIARVCDTSNLQQDKLPPPGCTRGVNDHSNVVLSGPVAGAVGLGFLWHMTRNLGFWLEARGMSSVGPVMFLGEVNAGLSVALKFEKSAPPPPKEGEGGWEKPPEADPLFETPPGE